MSEEPAFYRDTLAFLDRLKAGRESIQDIAKDEPLSFVMLSPLPEFDDSLT